MKLGRMTEHELLFIKDNIQNLNYIEIAEHLNREPKNIKKYIEDKLGMTVSLSIDRADANAEVNGVSYDIQLEGFWVGLKSQFMEEDQIVFKSEWNSIIDQFGGDVLPTEKLQIIDVIKLGILMSQCLKDRHKNKITINELNIELEVVKQEMKEARLANEDIIRVEKKEEKYAIQQQILFFMTSEGSLTKEYREFQDRRERILKGIKGTREQRVQRIENLQESFLAWIQDLVNDPDKRRESGKRMEKLRLATIDEGIRLAAYHKYDDGVVDQPFLNCDTVKDDNGKQFIGSERK